MLDSIVTFNYEQLLEIIIPQGALDRNKCAQKTGKENSTTFVFCLQMNE